MSLAAPPNVATPTSPGGNVGVAPAPVPPLQRPQRRKAPSLLGTILAYVTLTLGALAMLVPFYFLLNGSLRTETEVAAGDVIRLPAHLHPDNYGGALEKLGMVRDAARGFSFPGLANTVVVTVCCVVGQVISCSLVGFGFARFRFRGRGVLFMLMISTMMLPAQVTMIPVFVLFKQLGMIDSLWPLIIPAWLGNPFYVFMFRQFFTAIPEELLEAAKIDGCSNWRIYWRIMLPLSGPVIAIVAIQTFMYAWNDFMGPLIYLNSPENRTLSLALQGFVGQYGKSDQNLLMAATIICMLPCVLLFFAAQRYFVESVASSGLKS